MKNKGFILISTITVISILIFNYTIMYKLIRVQNHKILTLDKKINELSIENFIDTIIEKEFDNIENSISSGVYSNVEEYLCSSDKSYIWITNKEYSNQGYQIIKVLANKKTLFTRENTQNISNIISNYLANSKNYINTFDISIIKKFQTDYSNRSIIIKNKIQVKYKRKNILQNFSIHLKEIVVYVE